MIRVHVQYPNSEGAQFDMDYYLNKHMPLVAERCGDALKSYTVEQGLSGGMGGNPPANIATGTLEFESVDAFAAAMGPHMPEIMGDIPNYTKITPVLEIAEVKK
ncbi:MAG TPA: EthD family reductase [Acidimicrobiia bacterium]|nr:EthD family reductase [Acidimicrobiia bacterium]